MLKRPICLRRYSHGAVEAGNKTGSRSRRKLVTLLGVSVGSVGSLGSWFWGASWVREGWSGVPQGAASPAALLLAKRGKRR